MDELEYIMDLNSRLEEATSNNIYASKEIDEIFKEIRDKKTTILANIEKEFEKKASIYKEMFGKNNKLKNKKVTDNITKEDLRNIVIHVNSYKYILSAESNLEQNIKDNKERCRCNQFNEVNNRYLH